MGMGQKAGRREGLRLCMGEALWTDTFTFYYFIYLFTFTISIPFFFLTPQKKQGMRIYSGVQQASLSYPLANITLRAQQSQPKTVYILSSLFQTL